MEQFCADLQRTRARHGASLDEIAATTRVPRRHLLALEEGHFADLPGGIFRKGILRSYLGALGVDPTPWLPRFEAALAASELSDPVLDLPELAAAADRGRTTPAPASAPTPSAAPGVTRWSGVVVALVLLLAFGWCVWRFALRGRVVLSSATVPTHSQPTPRL